MSGIVNIKLKKLIELFRRNIIIIIILFLPLFLHYISSYYKVVNINFNLNHLLIGRDIYLIIISIYLTYLFVEIINILRKPNIKWEIVNIKSVLNEQGEDAIEGQILLKVTNHGDFLNGIFGQNALNDLAAIITIGGGISNFWGRWISKPEPVSYQFDPETKNYIPVPNYSNDGRKTDIISGLFDHLLILWKKRDNKGTEKYYIYSDYNYLNRSDEKNRIDLPNDINILIYDKEDIYQIKTTLKVN